MKEKHLCLPKAKRMIDLLVVLSGLFLCGSVYGQDNSDDHLFGRDLKCIEFASPNQWSFYKYIENPVNLYNGTPDVSLTLYTLTDCGIELPLTLRYNTSGIKVEEEASWVGLGWNLNVGGSINRNVIDGFDERDDTFDKYKGIFYDPGLGYVHAGGGIKITEEIFDKMVYYNQNTDPYHWGKLTPDVYYFSYPGNAGKYVIDHRDNSVRVLQRERDLLIDNPVPSSSDNTPSKTIVTPEGVRHEYTYSDQTVNRFHLLPVSQTFLLTKTRYPNGAQIDYKYGYFIFSKKKVSSYICGTLPSHGQPYQDAFKAQSEVAHNETYLDGTESYLSVVSTPNYRIEFTVSPRQDYENGQKLDRIVIRDKSGAAIKQFVFEYDYFRPAGSVAASPSNLRLKLNRVYEKSVLDETSVNAYRFTYNTTPLPDKLSYSTDYWGYANNPRNQSAGNVLPDLRRLYWNEITPGNDYDVISGVIAPQYDKSHNSDYCQAGMLAAIEYPTGGRTSFKYESNSFWGKYIPSSHERIEPETESFSYTIKDQNHETDKTSVSIETHGTREFTIDYKLYRGYNTWKDVAKSAVRHPFSSNGFYPVILADFEQECMRRYDSGDKSSEITGSTSLIRKGAVNVFQVNFPNELGDQFSSSAKHGYLEATISYKDRDPTLPIVQYQDTVSYGCGMRIAAIEYFDAGATAPMMVKRYSYDIPGTQRTSGKLFDKPKFDHIYENVAYGYVDENINPQLQVYLLLSRQFEVFDNSISSSPYGSGSGVGYGCVTETTDGQEGRTETCFHNADDTYIPFSYRVEDPLNGKMTSRTVYNGQNRIVEQHRYEYDDRESAFYYGVTLVNQYEKFGSLINPASMFWDTFQYFPNEILFYPDHFKAFFYALNTHDITLARETVTTDGVCKQTDYTYDPETLQMKSSTQQVSGGEVLVQQYTYPTDYAFFPYDILTDRHIISPVVEKRILHDGKLIFSKLTTCDDRGYFEKQLYGEPSSSTSAATPAFVKGEPNAALYPLDNMECTARDARCNPLHYRLNETSDVVYLWGYNFRHPIAEIRGATCAAVESALGRSISACSQDATPDYAPIDSLRVKLRQALVTTYKYDASGNISEIADPRGQRTVFTYDSFGRLVGRQQSHGADLEKTEAYQYHTKQ